MESLGGRSRTHWCTSDAMRLANRLDGHHADPEIFCNRSGSSASSVWG